ncbi:MAG: sulfatase-like hydrolase/transferase [Lachnospiraceae bacterium]|nr:sulfatase-like hydrolase/transferase [Lachnospiraceae bacterium]MDD7664965.1 sulfatase-like hydrolase/transferase [Lachnospiraceae bacterium]MDY4164214.1 sulfatase-like hydrolase/transferase [Lachnospiraceae bacterium]
MKRTWKSFSDFFEKYALILHIPLAMLLVLVNESLSRHSLIEGFGFITNHTGAFLYNSFIIYVILLLVFLSPRRLFMRIVMMAIVILFGIINCIILNNRVTPFGFTDLAMIGDLLTMQNTKYFTAQQAGISLIAILIFVFLMVMLHMHSKKKTVQTKLWVRILVCAIGFASLFPVTKACQAAGVVQTYFGNLAQGYLDNGYAYGFAMSVVGRGMNEPSGYSEKAVDDIIKDTEKGDSTLGSVKPNIIVVLLESCFDIDEYPALSYNEDPIPYFHELEKKYSTGHLTVPVVGAGTCNTEFEILTGMSCKFFGPGEYPQKTVLKKRDCESTADVIKKLGYGTHVVHNNGGNFYSRANAFSQMGFDTFTSKELLDITDYTPLNTWPTDDILVGATKDALDSTNTPDFCYTITVGTHGDYPTEKVIENPKIKVKVKGVDQGRQNQWEYYCNMLNNMDHFLKEYTDMLEKRGEPTLLICFGDHLPTMGLQNKDVKQNDIYQTKYITWNNFGMKKQDQDLTAYQLVSEYFDRLGIHGGTMVDYNQTMTERGVSGKSQKYLKNLQMLQYDLLYGDRYAYHGVDMYPASDLVMGINPVVIDNVYYYDNRLHIYGENFTPWSKVFVNGEKVNTTYESGQVLSISAKDVTDGSYLVVNQMGSNNTIFRSSNEYELKLPNTDE